MYQETESRPFFVKIVFGLQKIVQSWNFFLLKKVIFHLYCLPYLGVDLRHLRRTKLLGTFSVYQELAEHFLSTKNSVDKNQKLN